MFFIFAFAPLQQMAERVFMMSTPLLYIAFPSDVLELANCSEEGDDRF